MQVATGTRHGERTAPASILIGDGAACIWNHDEPPNPAI
jgi:hypothetical protein